MLGRGKEFLPRMQVPATQPQSSEVVWELMPGAAWKGWKLAQAVAIVEHWRRGWGVVGRKALG